jgi:hypothetical protein
VSAKPATSDEDAAGAEIRCTCGALVAREREGWVEVKCRRCKRGIRLRWTEPGGLVVETTTTR